MRTISRLAYLLIFASGFLTGQIRTGQIEIEGKWHTYKEIISGTRIEKQILEGVAVQTRYKNPFDGAMARLVFMPCKPFGSIPQADKYWFVPVPDFSIQISEGVPAAYELKLVLVPLTLGPSGSEIFKLGVYDADKPGLPYEILKSFIEALEKQRNQSEYQNAPAVIEMRGKLFMSGLVQNVKNFSRTNAQIEYTFIPEQANVLPPSPSLSAER